MSQDSGSREQASLPSKSRASLARHKAVGPYADLQKPEGGNGLKKTPYLNFMREKRNEILNSDSSISKKQVMKAVITAWNQLTPEEKKAYKASDSPEDTPTPAKRPTAIYPEVEKREYSLDVDMGDVETGQSETVPSDRSTSYLSQLGNVLKKVAGYFSVRPI